MRSLKRWAAARTWVMILAMAALYYAAGRLGVLLALPPGIASPVWLPSGIALAAVLLGGRRVWPGIWLGSFGVNVGTLLNSGSPLALAASLGAVAAIATGSTLQALLAGYLTRKLIGAGPFFTHVRDVLVFAAVAAASCLVAATIGASALAVSGMTARTGYGATWLTWWLGDLVGILLVVPLALEWRTPNSLHRRQWRLLEAAALLLCLLIASQLVFGNLFPAGRESRPLPHLLVPLIVWAAIRFGQRGVILTAALIALLAIGSSIQGWGPFPGGKFDVSLLWLQSFVGVTMVTGLVLAAAFTERRATEQALRESRENFRALSDATPVMVWQSGLDKGCHYFNKAWLEFTGRPLEQERGEGWAEGVYPEDLARCLHVYNSAFNQRTPFEMEYRLRHHTGEYRWILDRGTPRFDQGGTFLGYIGGCIDIDDRKRAEEARQAGEDKLRRVVESAPSALVMTNAAGRIVMVNAQTEKLFGYQREDLIGQPVEILVPERFRARHPGYRQGFMAAPQTRPMGAGRDLYGRRKDGSEVPVEIGLNPIRTDEGVLVLASIVDITERKRMEQALHSQAALIDLSPDAIIVRTLDGTIQFWSKGAVELYGWTQAEALGATTHRLLRTQFPIPFADILAQLERDQFWSGELVHTAKAGRRIVVDSRWVMQRDEKSATATLMESNVDITERKRAEEEIRQLNAELEHRVERRTAALAAANRELEAFGYTVSHDLRAPLRHIMGFIELLDKDAGESLNETGREYVRIIAEAGRRMGGLIDDLLALSRIGRATLNEVEVDLSHMVEEVRRELAPLAVGREIEWRVGALPVVRGDPTLLHSVMVNLLSNAIKYTRVRNPARIEMGCQEQGGENVFFVRDNGAGFDMRFAHKLFGVFQRLHRAEEFEGTGVGLASVRRIIERHSGRVWAEGEVDRGAAFYFTLPQKEQGT